MSECIEVFVGMAFLCQHLEEYGISFTRKKSSTSKEGEEGALHLKIKVVEKVVEHFFHEKHSASPIRVDGVIETHSRILSFLDNLEKLGSVLLEETGMFIKGAEELKEITSIKQVHNNMKDAKYTDAWAKRFTSSKKDSLSNILHLVEILLVVPISNATLERMFSAMNRVHTDWRNCLGEKRVGNLLRIFEEGSAIEQFDPKAALSRWCNKCATQRRPSVEPSGPRKEPTASGSKRTLPQSDVVETAKRLVLIEDDDA